MSRPRRRVDWFRVLLVAFVAFLYVAALFIVSGDVISLGDVFAWGIGAFTALLLLIDSRQWR